ncbi:uncharacterized protein LOC142235198 [Haematobia irritans]|uniref:uncharacterized protein LOC142235198 n=1 Tax=Haematobia irritans TaxID=7368 RepID=UPI003F4FB49A
MPPRKRLAKTVWSYFENQPEIGKAVCNLCNLKLKNNRNFNLKSHLEKIHKLDVSLNENPVHVSTADATPSTLTPSNVIGEAMQINKNSSNDTIISCIAERKQSIKVKISKKVLFRSYIGLITDDNLPFSVFNSSNMRNIVEPLGEALGVKMGKCINLNAQSLDSALSQIAVKIRGDTQGEIAGRLISLKIDRPKELMRNIFVLSAQFISDDRIKTDILGVVQVSGDEENASQNLVAEVLRTLERYDIELDQIVSITSYFGCSVSKEISSLSNSRIGRNSNEVEEYNNKDYMDNITHMDSHPRLRIGHIQVAWSASYAAHLCAFDITKDPEILRFLLSCRNFVKFIHNPSNGFKNAFEYRHFPIPHLDSSRRWGSTYEMIQALLEAKEILTVVKTLDESLCSEQQFVNTPSLWKFMEAYTIVFTPLQDALDKFQVEHLHYGNFYAQWLKCKMLTSKTVQNNNEKVFVKRIGTALLNSMEERMSHLLVEKSFNACLFLDPRFHHTLSVEQRQEAIDYLKCIWEKIRDTSNDETLLMATDTTFQDEGEELLNLFLTEKLQTPAGDAFNTDVYAKIENLHMPFMRSDTDVLHFWKEKKHSEPQLYALSKVCFGIPTTEVTFERAFPSLRYIVMENYNQIAVELLENVILVKLNSKTLNEAINSMPLFEEAISEEED